MKKLGRLILTSGGYLDGQRTEECDNIIRTVARDGKVLVVDNGSLTGSNKNGAEGVKKNFVADGNDVEIVTLTENNIDCIKGASLLYFIGGDNAPLIALAQSEKVREKLLEFLLNGGCIVGESSGSIIFGEDSKYYYDIKRGTKPKWDVVLPTYNGFGFCDKQIYPHYNKASDDQKQKINDYEKEHNTTIDRLADGEWIEVDVRNLLVRNRELK